MTRRKISAMHHEYGMDVDHQCKDCCNFVRRQWNKTYFKCAAYGLSHSEATDWVGKNTACGLFGMDFETLNRRPLVEVISAGRTIDEPLPGQMGLMDMEGAQL